MFSGQRDELVVRRLICEEMHETVRAGGDGVLRAVQ
jgi:hypothetical protein